MLFWENEDSANWAVHHLTVLCYHLQHPSLYAPDGLEHATGLLIKFDEGVENAACTNARQVDLGKRQFKITTGDAHGAYAHPVTWTMTTADVVAGGIERYIEQVNEWARSMLAAYVGTCDINAIVGRRRRCRPHPEVREEKPIRAFVLGRDMKPFQR